MQWEGIRYRGHSRLLEGKATRVASTAVIGLVGGPDVACTQTPSISSPIEIRMPR